MYLLSGLIGISILGSMAVLGLNIGASTPMRARVCALMTSLICLSLSIVLYQQFDLTQPGLQFQEQFHWVSFYNIQYALGVDGLSLPLIFLTIFMTFIVIIGTWHILQDYVAPYLALLLMTQGILIACFSATDALFFYISWEAILIPMMLMIGCWGSLSRARAALKFFMVTFLSSALMLVAFLYLGHGPDFNFSISHFYELKLTLSEQIWIFLSLFIAFAVKVPLWPFHTWLPDAHTEAPAGGSMLLAALMLKLGGYGLIRFCLPIVPDACRLFAKPLCVLAIISIVLVGLITLVQRDIKRLIAYSSIAHMGIVVLGIFIGFFILAPTPKSVAMSLQGAMFQMIAHGFSSSALFLAIGILYHHFHSRSIEDYSGLAQSMPILAAFFMCFVMANVGLPGTANFVGEFLVILGAMQINFWLSVAAATTLILSAAYTLYLYKSLFWGKPKMPITPSLDLLENPHGAQNQGLQPAWHSAGREAQRTEGREHDRREHHSSSLTTSLGARRSFLKKSEVLAFSGLAGATILFGIWPKPVFELMQPSLDFILQLSMRCKL